LQQPSLKIFLYGKLDATMAEVEAAASASDAHSSLFFFFFFYKLGIRLGYL
jgi:hypothetical protein